MLYVICGIRNGKKGEPKFVKVCYFIKTEFPLFTILPDPILQVLGTELNRSLEEMKDIRNYRVISEDDLPAEVKDFFKSSTAKEIEREQGVVVCYYETAPTKAFE